MKLKSRKANRLKGYDYCRDNLYFITVCVLDRVSCFGNIDKNEIMHYNKYGAIVDKQWGWLEKQYPYLKSHAFVVMPNHIHGILEINTENYVGTGRDLSLQPQKQKIKSISELIGAYKTTSSKQIHLLGYEEFKWQRSFHDHIIRNQDSATRIIDYINENPIKWENDKYFINYE